MVSGAQHNKKWKGSGRWGSYSAGFLLAAAAAGYETWSYDIHAVCNVELWPYFESKKRKIKKKN